MSIAISLPNVSYSSIKATAQMTPDYSFDFRMLFRQLTNPGHSESLKLCNDEKPKTRNMKQSKLPKRSTDMTNLVVVNNSPAGEVDPRDAEWPIITKMTIARTATVVKNNLKKADDKIKKKKKWKVLDPEEIGLNTSLLPRKCANDYDLPTHPRLNEETIDYDVCMEIDNIENKLDSNIDLDIAEGYHKNRHYFRRDRHRRKIKAAKQVKNNHLMSVKNNPGRRKLYIHHRVYKQALAKRNGLECRSAHYLKSWKINNHITQSIEKPIKNSKQGNAQHSRSAPAQNLKYALDNHNATDVIPTDMLNVLISLQHRELNPEDYALLLRLDESVAPQTVSETVIASFKTDIVDDSSAGSVCAICMDPYEIGQTRKFLPCDHVFHQNCIEMWLNNSSLNCPLDGLPVDT